MNQDEPYQNFEFRIRWDGRYVAGAGKVSILEASTEAVTHCEGGDSDKSRKQSGAQKGVPITIERALTVDAAFYEWLRLGPAAASSGSEESHREVVIELLNEHGRVAVAYRIHRCWISEYQALPDLDANGNGVAIESLVMQHEGVERVDRVDDSPGS